MENYLIWNKEAEKRRVLKDINYNLKIYLSKNQFFAGKMTVKFVVEKEIDQLWLDFNGTEVWACRVNKESVQVRYENFRIFLGGFKEGENFVEVEYLNRYSRDGFGLHYFEDKIDGRVYVYSHFEPFSANRAFPCFDQPDLKAIFNLWVKAPKSWKVVSSELAELSTEDIGDFPVIPDYTANEEELVHFFPGKFKTSPYIFPLCAGQYYEISDPNSIPSIPVRLFCRRSISSSVDPKLYFSFMKSALSFYQDFFEYDYPFTKLDIIFVPEFVLGAMENIACLTFNEYFLCIKPSTEIFNQTICNLICHEISHMWFGDLVSILWWDDIWLKESFATIMASICIDKALNSQFPNVWEEFCRSKTWGYNTDQLITTHSISTEVKNTAETRTNFDGISYSKGSAVLKQLFFVVGEKVFQAACSKFIKKFEYGVASCQDFIECVENEANFNVVEWADQWLFKAGVNVLEPEFCVEEENREICEFVIRQSWDNVGDKVLRQHFVIVEGFDDQLRTVFKDKVKVSGDCTKVESFLGIKAEAVLVNAEDWGYCKVRIDDKSWKVFNGRMHLIQSPLNRMVLYRAMLMMVKDLSLSGAEYLNCILNQISNENDPSAATYLLENIHFVLDNCIPIENLEQVNLEIFEKIKQKIVSEGKSETSIVYKNELVYFLNSQQNANEAIKWLKNNHTGIKGFFLRFSDKIEIIKAFARYSQDAIGLIGQFLGSVSNSFLNLTQLYCEGKSPTVEGKQLAWDKILASGSNLSRFERKNLMLGFNDRYQINILQDFKQLFFDNLKSVIVSQDKEFAIDYCSFLVPMYAEESWVINELEKILPQIPQENFEVLRKLTESLENLKLSQAFKSLSSNYSV